MIRCSSLCFTLLFMWPFAVSYGSEKPLKVAMMGEFMTPDGKSESWDEYIFKGVKLQMNQSNQIELVKINVTTPVEAYNEARKIAADKTFDLVFGFRRADMASMTKKATEPEKIPFISTIGTTEDLFADNGYTFGLAIRDRMQAKKVIEYFKSKNLSNSRIGVVVTKDCTYCVDLEREISTQIAGSKYSMERLAELVYYTPIDPKVFKNSFLDYGVILLLTDEVEGLSVIKILQQKKYRGTVIGGDSWSLLSMDVDAKYEPLRQICMVNILGYDPRSKSNENISFIKKYKSQYKDEPNDLAALGYDSMKAINIAASKCVKEKSENHRRCLRDSLKSLNFEGASGHIRFSPDGARLGKPQIIESKGCSLKG